MQCVEVKSSFHSSLPLEPSTRPQYSHALIHNPLPHTQVAVDPFLYFFALGYLILLKAGAKFPALGRSLATHHLEEERFQRSRATHSGLANVLDWGTAYVRPVERFTPARKAETGEAYQLGWLLNTSIVHT